MTLRIKLLFLLLTLPLVGCGLEGAAEEEPVAEETQATGGIASSEHYLFERGEIGNSFESMISIGQNYRIDATLGHHISEGDTLSRHFHYEFFQPVSRDLTTIVSDAETAGEEEATE